MPAGGERDVGSAAGEGGSGGRHGGGGHVVGLVAVGVVGTVGCGGSILSITSQQCPCGGVGQANTSKREIHTAYQSPHTATPAD